MMTRDRQQAALDRLRARGNHLAPVMVDGKVRPKVPKRLPTIDAEPAPESPISRPKGLSVGAGHDRPLASAFQPFELIIPAPAEWLNENQRLHWAPKAERVSAWRHEGLRAAGFADAPRGLPLVQIDAYVRKPRANRYDPANFYPTAKAVVDGLVDYGMVPDDNRKIVKGPFMHDGGKGESALIVVVTPLQANVTAA